eukprot:29625-Chlamydomonas_euryale.AAC.1
MTRTCLGSGTEPKPSAQAHALTAFPRHTGGLWTSCGLTVQRVCCPADAPPSPLLLTRCLHTLRLQTLDEWWTDSAECLLPGPTPLAFPNNTGSWASVAGGNSSNVMTRQLFDASALADNRTHL